MKSKAQLNWEVMKEQEDKFIEGLKIGDYNTDTIKELLKGIRQTEREKTKEEIIELIEEYFSNDYSIQDDLITKIKEKIKGEENKDG